MLRLQNHDASAQSKVPSGRQATSVHAVPGDLVYLKCDGTKHIARDRYIVTAVDTEFATVQKLTGLQFRSKQYRKAW